MRDALQGLTTRGRSFVAAGLAVLVASIATSQKDLLRVAILLLALPLVERAGGRPDPLPAVLPPPARARPAPPPARRRR